MVIAHAHCPAHYAQLVLLEDWRPWVDDDATEYESLARGWPHDESQCVACQVIPTWTGLARSLGATAGRDRRQRWRSDARAALRRAYPNRYQLVLAHRAAVSAAARAAPEAQARVGCEAVKFLAAGLRKARSERLIPRRWSADPRRDPRDYEGPWPRHWPCVEIARSDLASGFVESLRQAYPQRFPSGSAFPFADPREYAAAFIRSVIAEAIRLDLPLRANSLPVQSLLCELHGLVSRQGQTFASLWLIDDVDFSAVQGRAIDAVTFASAGQLDRAVASFMPEAWWSGFPMQWASALHGGLLYASGEGFSQHFDTTDGLNLSIRRLVDAIHLATGCTGFDRWVWMGEPSRIHLNVPESHPQTELGITEPRWRRVATITPAELPGIAVLSDLLSHANKQIRRGSSQPTVSSVAVALSRYRQSLESLAAGRWRDAVVDLSIALEATLSPGDEHIENTLRLRAAHFLDGDDKATAAQTDRDVKHLYDLRSDLVHGNTRYKRTPAKLCEERGYTDLRLGMWFLLDRWRDIVRRLICVRLLLSETRCDLWPLIGKTRADDLLMPDKRGELQRRIAGEATAIGLPRLLEPTTPLVNDLQPARSSL